MKNVKINYLIKACFWGFLLFSVHFFGKYYNVSRFLDSEMIDDCKTILYMKWYHRMWIGLCKCQYFSLSIFRGVSWKCLLARREKPTIHLLSTDLPYRSNRAAIIIINLKLHIYGCFETGIRGTQNSSYTRILRNNHICSKYYKNIFWWKLSPVAFSMKPDRYSDHYEYCFHNNK